MCDRQSEMTGSPPDRKFTTETCAQSEAGHQRSVRSKSEVSARGEVQHSNFMLVKVCRKYNVRVAYVFHDIFRLLTLEACKITTVARNG